MPDEKPTSPDLLLAALRSVSTDALENADSFTASDFSCVMSALAENFQALDAAMLRRRGPRDWSECDACAGHGASCTWCQGSGLMRYHPTTTTLAETVRVHSKERDAWGTIAQIKKDPDGTMQHRVRWDAGPSRYDWIELGTQDNIENFHGLSTAWAQYPARKEYTR